MLYNPPRFAYPKKAAGELARKLGFGTLVSISDGELQFSHIPLLTDLADGAIVRVRGHLARNNPHVEALRRDSAATIVFNGPNTYVSAQWYSEGCPAAPSWAYVVVHVSGHVHLLDNAEETSAIIDELVITNEAQLPQQWSLETYSPERRARLLPHIIGFTLEVEHVEAKFKLNQHYSNADKHGAIRGLRNVGTDAAREIADLMETTIDDARDGKGLDIDELERKALHRR